MESALREVLDHVIAFTPTVVTVQDSAIVGARVYVFLLLADEEGEAAIEHLSRGRLGRNPETETDRSAVSTRL